MVGHAGGGTVAARQGPDRAAGTPGHAGAGAGDVFLEDFEDLRHGDEHGDAPFPDLPDNLLRVLAALEDDDAVQHGRDEDGHGLADLWLESNEPDAAIFVYVSEVEADGTVRYVTEGLLRALHRKESAAPDTYRTTWPFRSFRREDIAPLVPGRAERIRIPLLPISWVFAKGSRIRLSIAGADAEHCVQVPHGRPPRLTILRGGETASALELPLRPAGARAAA